jgi:hypothetical protein
MKYTLLSLMFLILCALPAQAQKKHLEQSAPFEQVVRALLKQNPVKFRDCFSERLIGSDTDISQWEEHVLEGREHFNERYPNFKSKDFRYGYDAKSEKLIVFFRGEEIFRIRVVQEKGKWKLDEK